MTAERLRTFLREDPVVITGAGAFSAGGGNAAELWESVEGGESPAVFREYVWGKEYWRTAVCEAPEVGGRLAKFARSGKWDRSIQLAAIAAGEALGQAGLPGGVEEERVGIILGTSRGPRTKWMESVEKKSVRPSDGASSTLASMTGVLAQCYGIRGASMVVSATCASGGAAIALGAQQILLGTADAVLVGGADAPLNALMIAQLRASGIIGSHEVAGLTCRPFDRSRNGLCLGEGAGFLVLELLSSAERRGARPLAKLAGWGLGTDHQSRVSVDRKGTTLVRTMREALWMAGVEEVQYVNAHGTGTVMNDEAEANAMAEVFGAGSCPPCGSTKPVTGHCLGATPVIEAVLCLKALEHQVIPRTVNCADPEFPLDVVPLRSRPARLENVLSNSLGFWGTHSSLLFSRVP